MGMNAGSGELLNSDINVTPLVDVVLVLLIIFMIVTPLTQRGYDIDIPRAIEGGDPIDRVTLSISENECPILQPLGPGGLPPGCKVLVNKQPITLTVLPTKMGEIFRNRRKDKKILFVAAQETLNYEGVVQILDLAKGGAGDDLKIAIVTDEKLATASATDN